jgi:hypothetical protein
MLVGINGANKKILGGYVGVNGENKRIVRIIAGINGVNKTIWEARSEGERIFGVSWNKGPDPTLTRTDDAVGMVANAGVGSQVVQNDFDSAPIYRNITEVTDSYGNVFVRIPKFYIRKTDSANLRTWQISEYPHPGFYLPWCFWDFANQRELPYVDIGKYNASLGASDRLESKPGVMPLGSRGIVNFRTYARNNNTSGLQGYQQYDIHVHDIITVLFYVEFATLDSQSVMAGLTDGLAYAESGLTDGVVASSGSPTSNTSGAEPCKYRGIENPWGNVYQYVDGVNINNRQAWVAKNAEDYTSNVFAHPYEYLGYINHSADGYPTAMGFDPSLPFAEFPTAVGGSNSTYYADRYYQNTDQRIARVGGNRSEGVRAGVSCWALNYPSVAVGENLGGRLVKKAL